SDKGSVRRKGRRARREQRWGRPLAAPCSGLPRLERAVQAAARSGSGAGASAPGDSAMVRPPEGGTGECPPARARVHRRGRRWPERGARGAEKGGTDGAAGWTDGGSRSPRTSNRRVTRPLTPCERARKGDREGRRLVCVDALRGVGGGPGAR